MTATLLSFFHVVAVTAFGNAPLKCGAPPGGDALVALDGKIVPITVQEVEREKALYVQVVCVGEDGSTFSHEGTGVGVASVWTVDGPLPDMKPTLETILAAQVAHRESSGTYLESLDGIDLTGFHPDVSLTLRATSGGWVAIATADNLLAQCVVFEGVVTDLPDGAVGGQAICIDDLGHAMHW